MTLPAGRNTKLTPEVADAICKSILEGLPISHAAGGVGVHPTTVHRWIAFGLADLEEGKETLNAGFARRVGEARSAKVRRWIAHLERAATTPNTATGQYDTKALQFLLQSTEPREFGARQHIEVDARVEHGSAKDQLESVLARLDASGRTITVSRIDDGAGGGAAPSVVGLLGAPGAASSKP